jgi:hypothetical protein
VSEVIFEYCRSLRNTINIHYIYNLIVVYYAIVFKENHFCSCIFIQIELNFKKSIFFSEFGTILRFIHMLFVCLIG